MPIEASTQTDNKRLLILLAAGISGAGKSTALDVLSDLGFYGIDNLPVPLFASFLVTAKRNPQRFARTALLLDIESRDKLNELMDFLKTLDRTTFDVKLLFFDAATPTIIKRYSETRRPHPGFDPVRDQTLADAIERERNRFTSFKEIANIVFDTTTSTVHDLKRDVKSFIDSLGFDANKDVRVNFVSFGFKHGIPNDCDLIVDVRFLPNPHFVENLKDKTGLEKDVQEFVLNREITQQFLLKYSDLLAFLLPNYIFEGKSYINIGVGCTGGKHRSVALCQALYDRADKSKYIVSVKHRDLARP